MIKIAIVDDINEHALMLKDFLLRYATENHFTFEIDIYNNAVPFIEKYKADFDVVFFDILMPYLDGVNAARALREKDSNVILFFITATQQYALEGYEVDALDYILKPISYYEFALKFTKAIKKLGTKQPSSIVVKTNKGYKRIFEHDILYVEVIAHHCYFHTKDGVFKQYQTMKNVIKILNSDTFVKCNNCYLVNLAYVSSVKNHSVIVNGEALLMSHPRKKEFTNRYLAYASKRK
ncbi:MAG TPA: response regulator transcription factor [Erysipelotrichaceae bacterium]|nr:response regulator transcription factor [Erysipelotrichaceae bacterium]